MSSNAEPGDGAAPALSTANALDVFTRSTSLAPEHRRLMEGRHRSVPWEKSTAHELPLALRERMAELWRGRMLSEHRSVGVFSLYVHDLLGAGAPAEILSHACRAALDEVRHTELFSRLASLYSGRTETPEPGIPAMADDPAIPIRHQVAREALQLAVFSETYSSVLLSALHDRAEDVVVRTVLGIVIADEVHHARMGWAFLASLLRDDQAGLGPWLARELRPVMDGLVASMFGDPATIPPSDLSEHEQSLARGHGFMESREEYALFCATLEDVWLPGLRAIGVDVAGLAGTTPPDASI